ncbi:PREDICTED: uncharacterized protein LOC108573302 [Habropoda laboriosa]|uniref:uncharacterized protein LOC108573302 n=1 Tax=Habropoda laboriosa TaxID=597456 RepID=UPI00083E0881|nr:PREDICTED: uncharacterized protein LOC108573302 [Habropoda laboriosa]
MPTDQIQYSEKYSDDKYEYRLYTRLKIYDTSLLTNKPHVLLFRRPRTVALINTRTASFQREYQNVYCV